MQPSGATSRGTPQRQPMTACSAYATGEQFCGASVWSIAKLADVCRHQYTIYTIESTLRHLCQYLVVSFPLSFPSLAPPLMSCSSPFGGCSTQSKWGQKRLQCIFWGYPRVTHELPLTVECQVATVLYCIINILTALHRNESSTKRCQISTSNWVYFYAFAFVSIFVYIYSWHSLFLPGQTRIVVLNKVKWHINSATLQRVWVPKSVVRRAIDKVLFKIRLWGKGRQ